MSPDVNPSGWGQLLLWLLIGLPAISGVALCVLGRAANRSAAAVSLVTAGLTALTAVAASIARPAVDVPFLTGFTFGLAVDALSALIVPTVAVVTLAVLAFAAAEGTQAPARFHGLMLIFAASVAVTATATTLPTLLFAWEIMGALSYALIGFQWRDEFRVSAGLTAFITTRVGDLGLYAAAGAALAGGTGLTFADLADAPPGWRDVVAAGILLAAFGKAAQLPFSFWLSRAMEGPSPVSALLHSAAMVAMGGYLLLRFAPFLQATGWAATTAAWVGALTALLLGIVAVAQRDLKQLLAASTAAQLGFIVLAAGVGAVAGGTAHLVAHAATKSLLFLAAGAWLTALGTKQLHGLRGVARRWPVVGVAFSAGALSLAGVAPLSLWATKDEVLAGALAASPALYVVGLAATALSAAYAGKALVIVWSRPLPTTRDAYDTEQQGTQHVGLWERIPLLVLATGAVLLGVLALPPLGDQVRLALGAVGEPRPTALELVGSAVLAVVVVGLVAWKRVPEPSWAANWLGLERAVHASIVAPVLWLSEHLARFDDAILDRGIHSVARRAVRGARRLAHFDDAGLDAAVTASARGGVRAGSTAAEVDTYGVDVLVEAVGRTARQLGRAARHPQSGQLHQYYAQITVLLTVALVLLLVVR